MATQGVRYRIVSGSGKFIGYVLVNIKDRENKDKEDPRRRYLQHGPASTRQRYSSESR